MQIKNNIKVLFILFLSLSVFNINLHAEEFNLTAKEILLDNENQIVTGKGTVKAIDSDGNIITADTITYKKSKEFLLAEGNVKITDKEGNILSSKKASYDKINELKQSNAAQVQSISEKAYEKYLKLLKVDKDMKRFAKLDVEYKQLQSKLVTVYDEVSRSLNFDKYAFDFGYTHGDESDSRSETMYFSIYLGL